MSDSRLYYGLKSLNAALAAAWSVIFVYSFVHAVGIEQYAVIASVTAVGGFVLVFDFGLAAIVYHRFRARVVVGQGVDASILTAALLVAAVCCLVAVSVFGIAVLLWSDTPLAFRISLVLLFLSVLLPLPAMSVRTALAALDDYLWPESLELARRLGMMVLALSMLTGVSLLLYGVGAIALWTIFFFVAGGRLRQRLPAQTRHFSLQRLQPAFGALRAQAGSSAIYTVSEFLVYNLPYYTLPLIYHDARAIVAFDTFAKCGRLAAMVFAAGSDSALPTLTSAFYRNDGVGVRLGLIKLFATNAAPLAIGVLVVAVFGENLFARLLGDPALMTASLRYLAIVMAICLFVQASSGPFLLAIGTFRRMAFWAGLVCAGVLALSVAAPFLSLSFSDFMIAYVVVYAIGSVGNFILLRQSHTAPLEKLSS